MQKNFGGLLLFLKRWKMIDLVAGYARGYNAEQIRPFLKSLRDTGYEGDILLFADGDAAKEAEKWDVEIHPVPKLRIKVHSDRFLCLEEVIKKQPCEGVFLADTRDVIFQKNPSNNLPSHWPTIHAFEEDESMSLGSCPYNSKWIKIGYGEDMLKELSGHPISCVGTISGDYLSILVYLKQQVEEVMRLQPKTTEPQDQATHNYLIRKVLKTTIWNNEEGEVYTVGYIPRGSVKIQDGKIINKAGKVPTVIHQWDRHKNLTRFVEERYNK